MIDYNNYIMYEKASVFACLKVKSEADYNNIQDIIYKMHFDDDIVMSVWEEDKIVHICGEAYYTDELFVYLESKISPYIEEGTFEFESPPSLPERHSKFWRHLFIENQWFSQEGQKSYQGFQLQPLAKTLIEKDLDEEYDEIGG